VQGVNEESFEKAEKTIFKTLKEVKEKGFEKELFE
jgi:Zn-dependent M16 (insulinase) family peptidase